MYVGIDVGGTKTLVAVLNDEGVILQDLRFETPHDYDQFLTDLKANFEQLNRPAEFRCVAGIPGHINRQSGVVYALGNLPWRDKPIQADIANIVGQPVLIENDARLAGLSEAQLIKDHYRSVLFATVSTGIGGALIQDGQIVRALQDMEMGKMPLRFNDQYVHWEDFAGGRGVVEYIGKKAADITDPADWKRVAEPLAYGLSDACSILQPDAVILGGPVGKYTNQFSAYIVDFFKQHLHADVQQPQAILAAQRPDEAVIYGCYDLAKQVYGHA